MADYPIRTHWGDEYIPLPTQLRWHQSQSKYRFYCGPIGSGKSLSGSVEALLTAIDEPGYRPGLTVIARDTYPNLVNTTWHTFSGVVKQTCPGLIADEKKSTHQIEMTLKNGWRFIGANLGNYENFGSLELSYFWIDEANDQGVGVEAYNMLCGRLRSRIGKRRGWCTGNPAGKNWAYSRFFQHRLEGSKAFKDHEGFQPTPTENIHLPEGYLDSLREFYPEEWVQKFLQGDFSIYEGAILSEMNPDLHLIDSFDVPMEWPRYRGLDHGINHPTACVWAAVDYDGNIYFYREHVKSDAVPATNAARILALSQAEEERIQWTAIDPSTRQRQTAGGQMAMIVDGYRDAGLHCRLANNDIKASIARLKMHLQPDETRLFPRWHRKAGETGAPKLFITRDCKVLWHQLQSWQWKAVKPGQVDRERVLARDDDAVSAARYLMMELPRSPQPQARHPQQWIIDAIEERDGASSKDLDLEFIGA